MARPIRNRLEPGIYERVNAAGDRLGLEIKWKDAEGRSHRRAVGGDIHDARDLLAAARTRRARHEVEPVDVRTTLTAVIGRYRQTVMPGLRPRSRKVYGPGLDRADLHFGGRRITSITRVDVRSWVTAMTAEGLKANTVRKYYAVLRTLYSFAARDLNMPVTFPALRRQDLPNVFDDQREHRVLTDDELQAILAELAPRDRLYFRLLAETGLRASEALAVTTEHVTGTTLRVRRQRGLDGKPAPLKSRQSRRDIEITKGLAGELRLASGFPHATYNAMRLAWRDAVDAVGVDPPLPVLHDLRHSHASRLIAAGWDPVEVAKRLGDRIETVLRVYVHEFDRRRRSGERQAALEQMYGSDGPQMAASTPSQGITDEPKTAEILTFPHPPTPAGPPLG
jgi:integrase